METISIVVATYNGSKYIKEQLESLLEQSVRPDEIIVMDDCSKDDTVKIANNLLEDSIIKHKVIINERQLGVIKNFEAGIRNSSGSLIFFCDQDDVWNKEKLKVFLDTFNVNSDIGAVISDATIVDEDLSLTKNTLWSLLEFPFATDNTYVVSKREIFIEMLKRNIFTGMCMAVKRDLALKSIPFPICMLHDNWLGWNSLIKSSVAIVPYPLVYYRQHKSNVMGIKHKVSFDRIKNAGEIIKKNIENDFQRIMLIKNIVGIKVRDKYLLDIMNEAIKFHQARYNLLQERVCIFRDISIILEMAFKGKYNRFTFNSYLGICKDILYVLFYK
jgi:glycosyltransferase involved in cell wall biosynthesis